MHQIQMLDAAANGRLKALWAIGYDVLLTNPNARQTAQAFERLELVIIQDMFMSETAQQFGSVFLPACSSFEKDGTFMNAERRIQRVRPMLAPAGQSKPDWQIICNLARAMGHPQGFDYATPQAIWDEVRRGCPGARGMSYVRLDVEGLQWPCPDEAHPGTPILHVDRFASEMRAPLMRVTYDATPERTTPKYPFVLTTGRALYEFNASTMTGRCRTRELRPSDLLEISPADAAALDVRSGDRIRVTSRYGSATLPADVTASVREGELFATFHTAKTFLNTVTGPHVDRATGTPEYKVTAVRIEKNS
jgi:formate dehydrogenase major subunit